MTATGIVAVRTSRVPYASRGSSLAAPGILLGSAVLGCALAVLSGSGSLRIVFWTLAAVVVGFAVGLLQAVVPGRRGWLRLRELSQGVRVVGAFGPRTAEACAAISCVVGAVLVAVSPVRGESEAAAVRSLVAAVGLAAVAVVPILMSPRRAFRMHGITLTEQGVVIDARWSSIALDWAAIDGCRFDKAAILVVGPGRRVRFPAGELRSDPVLAARLVDFYCRHPETRPELADGRALERVRQERLG